VSEEEEEEEVLSFLWAPTFTWLMPIFFSFFLLLLFFLSAFFFFCSVFGKWDDEK